MRVVLALIGAIVGARLMEGANLWFAAVVGGIAGLGIAEAILIAQRFASLQRDIDLLRADLRAWAERARIAPAPPTVATEAPVAVQSPARAEAPPEAPKQAPVTIAMKPQIPAARAASVAPPDSLAPDPLAPVAALVRDFFTGGNTLVRVGIVVLFFGVAFLLRYLAEHTRVPIQLRLGGVALAAVVLLLLGWRLRLRRPGYALALQGGAVGILYLIVFAALRLYGLLSPATAFPLLVALSALSATLAILQNSLAFELLAVVGGFLAPLLASSGQGDHVVLFTYYAVLNAAILATAWFRAWRALNVVGFLFTFVIATAWGVLRYRPEDFPTTEPFLILFFVFYVAIAVLFTWRRTPDLRGYIDGTLVFGTPIAAFGLQSAMLHERLLPLAGSALVVSAVYLMLAWLLHRSRRANQRLLVEAFLALGIAFLTLAIPLALSGTWTATSWALEGAALIWIGCRQNRVLPRAFGALLQLAAGCALLLHLEPFATHIVLPPDMGWSALTLGVAAVFAAHVLNRNAARLREHERALLGVLFFWGLIWWLIGGYSELQRRLPPAYVFNAALCFVALSALLASTLQRRVQLSIARIPALGLLPLLWLFAAALALGDGHPSQHGGAVAWLLSFAVLCWTARHHEGPPERALARSLHAASTWLLTVLLCWELQWQVWQAVGTRGSWSGIAWAIVPALLLALMPVLVARVDWPFALHRRTYLNIAAAGLAWYLAAWVLATTLWMRGDSQPLPYLPLLNPLDLAQLFVLIVLLRYALIVREDLQPARGPVGVMLAALLFVALNGALLRTLHHWFGVPFSIDATLQSTLVQTSLSIFWAVLSLTTMLTATRLASRVVWLAGAALLGIVVVKLFVVDLSRIGTIERIVSFVGVGVLMLVVGYLSPLPPAVQEQH